MKRFFESIEFGKLALNTGPGLIATVAVLLLVDACSRHHITAEILAGKSAGYIVVAAVIIIAASSIVGLMFCPIFHTFGRSIAQAIWPKLDQELKYRKKLMTAIGLDSEDEFEWVRSNGKKISTDDIESHYLRNTEVTGNSAYATVLLSIAMSLFLRWEYNTPPHITIIVSMLIMIAALILLFISAASLEKYEMHKTAMAMDEIRRLNPHPQARRGTICDRWPSSWKSLVPLFLLPLLSFVAWGIGNLLYNPSFPAEGQDIAVISALENNTVPVIDISVTINASENLASSTLSRTINAGKRISLDNTMYCGQNLSLRDESVSGVANLTQLVSLPDSPGWQLKATLGKDIAAGNAYLNVQLAFDTESNSKLHTGTWLLPVIVTNTDSCKEDSNSSIEYLLAYVQVIINAAE